MNGHTGKLSGQGAVKTQPQTCAMMPLALGKSRSKSFNMNGSRFSYRYSIVRLSLSDLLTPFLGMPGCFGLERLAPLIVRCVIGTRTHTQNCQAYLYCAVDHDSNRQLVYVQYVHVFWTWMRCVELELNGIAPYILM